MYVATTKWNESGFKPLLCTYRLNWARRTSWGWWDEWDDTALQTHDSKFEPWRSEAEHATSRSRKLPTILSFTSGWGRNILVSFKPPRPGNEPRALAWKAAVLTTTLGPPPVATTNSLRNVLRWQTSVSQTVAQHWNDFGWTWQKRWGRRKHVIGKLELHFPIPTYSYGENCRWLIYNIYDNAQGVLTTSLTGFTINQAVPFVI